MKGVVKAIVWTCYAAAVVYIGYAWYTYSGLYRLAVEWQLETFESYSLKMTLLGLVAVVVFPIAIVARLLGGKQVSEPGRLAEALNAPKSLALLGVVLLIVGAGAGWLGYQKSQETITYEPVDLNAGQTPSSQHVVLTGIAHTEFLVQFETKRSGSSRIDNYIPIVSSAWRRGEPLVYFLKTNATAYLPEGGGRVFTFARTTPPFPMTTQKALLVRNGLPGPVGEVYRKGSIPLADPPVVLDLSSTADIEIYLIVAAIGGLVGFFMLVGAAARAVRRRRLRPT